LTMTIAGKIHLTNVPVKIANTLKKKLELPNPNYQQAIKRNPRARYTLSPVIKYYEDRHGDLAVPRGIISSIKRFLDEREIKYVEEDNRVTHDINISTSIKLRDYQQGVPEKIIEEEQGVIKASTGAGKTILALKVIELIGQKTLIIVPKLDLLNQFVREIKNFTDIDSGVIQGKITDIKDVTVATVQSLRNRIKDGRINQVTFGCVVVDECHLSVPKKSRDVVGFFSAKYRYGMTATSKRTDRQGQAINWIFGKQLVDIELPGMDPVVEIVEFKDKILDQEYHELIVEQIEHPKRNELLLKILKDKTKDKRKILVLFKRRSHRDYLYEELQKQIPSSNLFCMEAEAKRIDRDNLLSSLRKGDKDFNCIFATYSLFSTGISIPQLDCVVFAGDLKSDVLLEQGAGRCRRLFDGKKQPLIIDIHDTGSYILKNQGKARQKAYKELGWDIA